MYIINKETNLSSIFLPQAQHRKTAPSAKPLLAIVIDTV
jgi:hypothetical protein